MRKCVKYIQYTTHINAMSYELKILYRKRNKGGNKFLASVHGATFC